MYESVSIFFDTHIISISIDNYVSVFTKIFRQFSSKCDNIAVSLTQIVNIFKNFAKNVNNFVDNFANGGIM